MLLKFTKRSEDDYKRYVNINDETYSMNVYRPFPGPYISISYRLKGESYGAHYFLNINDNTYDKGYSFGENLNGIYDNRYFLNGEK